MLNRIGARAIRLAEHLLRTGRELIKTHTMPDTFSKQRRRFNEALDQADTALSNALGLLDDLPSFVTNADQARQLVDARNTTRDTLRAQQRRLEKL